MNWLFRYASWSKAGLFLALNFALQAVIVLVIYPMISADTDPLDIQMGLTLERVTGFLEQIGSDGRTLYFYNEATLDILFPLVYSIAYALLTVELIKSCGQVRTPLRYLALLPFAIAMCDLLENIQILVAIQSYPMITNAQVTYLAAANMGKHMFTMLLLSTLGVLLIWLAFIHLCRIRIRE
ncbi:hypothetical protein [Microbulbifer sp. ALW1]|uniref:hypothetical protein n=1 Tax=Microbulbifer sp. (strain ALW1) TaxID=1516059 RepID=UPI00135A40A4|nr:hypothetical protein [Microbulbifer sp. ALW1]